jgi:hypothetical protein
MEVWPLQGNWPPQGDPIEPGEQAPWEGALSVEWDDLGRVHIPFVLLSFDPLAIWNLRRRLKRRYSLTLDPTLLRLVVHDDGFDNVTEIPRADAGSLTRWVEAAGSERAFSIEMGDRMGRRGIELSDRNVKVTAQPFGLDLRSRGIDPLRAPLGLLVGAWWPYPAKRATRKVGLAWGKPDSAKRRPWGLPDLDGYACWEAKRRVREGLELVAMGVALFAFAVWFGVFVVPGKSSSGWLWGLGFGAVGVVLAAGGLRSVLRNRVRGAAPMDRKR